MAYRLERSTSGGEVRLSSIIEIPNNSDFVVEIKYLGPSSAGGSGRPFGNSSGFNNRLFIRESSPLLIFGGATSSFSTSPPAEYFTDRANRDYGVFRFSRTGGSSVLCEYNGQAFHTGTLTGEILIDQFFRQAGSTSAVGDGAEYISISINGVETNRYFKDSLSGENDTSWNDDVGGNNGTLGDFPTDNSQWVFFDDGGGAVTADAAFTVNTPTIASSVTATLPSATADVAFTVNAPSVAANVSATLPQPIADINYSVSVPTVAASVTASLPQPLSDVAFTVNAPSVAANAFTSQPSTNGYYLDFSKSSQGRVLCDFFASSVNPDWEVKFKFRAPESGVPDFYRVAGSKNAALFDNRILIKSDGTDFRFSYNGSQYIINPSPVIDLSQEPEISFVSNGSGVNLLIDGELKGTGGNSSIGCNIEALGANFDSYFNGGLYYFKFINNTEPSRSRELVKLALSGANDSIFTDLLGNQDGLQDGTWPADNGEWVPYSQATSSSIAFSVNTPSVAANATATIPGYNASVSFTVSIPSVSTDASATLPNPSADIAYTVSAPSINAVTNASLPQPNSDITFTINTPSVDATISATQTNWDADVSFAVNVPNVVITTNASLPQPETTVSFSISPPHVSVVAIVGGIAIIVDDETNITLQAQSTNIDLPALSNNLEI